MKIESADGKRGCLILCADGNYMIRIYDDTKVGIFKDYNISHCSLFFNINDDDAYLYEDGDKMCIDFSPETLGIEHE